MRYQPLLHGQRPLQLIPAIYHEGGLGLDVIFAVRNRNPWTHGGLISLTRCACGSSLPTACPV